MSVFISQNLYLTSTVEPLTHARIGYKSLLTSTNITASAAVSGFPVNNCLIDQTYEFYKPDVTDSTIVVDLGTAQNVDYFGVVGRNMGNIRLESSTDNVTFSTVLDVNDGTDVITMGLFDTVSARYFKFTFYGSGQEIVKVNLGEALAMPRPIYGGHTPITLNRKTQFKTNTSEGGQFLGRTVTRQGFNGQFNWQHIPAAWVRSYFDDFILSARTHQFFIAWRPASFSGEVGFCHTNSDITPSNMGVRDLMSIDLSCTGYDVESGL